MHTLSKLSAWLMSTALTQQDRTCTLINAHHRYCSYTLHAKNGLCTDRSTRQITVGGTLIPFGSGLISVSIASTASSSPATPFDAILPFLSFLPTASRSGAGATVVTFLRFLPSANKSLRLPLLLVVVGLAPATGRLLAITPIFTARFRFGRVTCGAADLDAM